MIYVYETLPDSNGGQVKRYEIKQSMLDPAMTHHPETGEPIRRVLVGGSGIITGKPAASRPSPPRSHGCGCGHGACGH